MSVNSYYRSLMNQATGDSAKRPYYDGVNDYSKSNFTINEWYGNANNTVIELTSGFLVDFTFKCNVVPPDVRRHNIAGLAHLIGSYTGVLFWTYPSGFVIDIYTDTGVLEYFFVEELLDGNSYRITVDAKISAGTLTSKVYLNGILKNTGTKACTYIYWNATTESGLVLANWTANTTNNYYAQFIKQFDLFQTGVYSDTQVADYLADRDALNANLYARFLLDEGSGTISYADNDVSRVLNHINITEPDFWQEY